MDELWADEMDAVDETRTTVDVGEEGDAAGDLLSAISVTFPSPGELWVHLCASCHYLSSILLETYPPPWDRPFLVKGVGRPISASPFRIEYGVHNPALRGTVITNAFVVPAFGWTPRMVVSADELAAALHRPCPTNLLVLPAVRGPVVRIFHYGEMWYIATGGLLEPIPNQGKFGRVGTQVDACMRAHVVQGLRGLTRDLRKDRVWFFAIFPDRATILGLGTCRVLSHHELRADVFGVPDYDFSVHNDLAPSIPILPALGAAELGALGRAEEVIEARPGGEGEELGLRYRGLFDGVLLVNPATFFAVRLGCAEAVFLAPLLRLHMTLVEFLSLAEVTTAFYSGNEADPASRAYRTETQPLFMRRWFGTIHGPLANRIHLRVRDL